MQICFYVQIFFLFATKMKGNVLQNSLEKTFILRGRKQETQIKKTSVDTKQHNFFSFIKIMDVTLKIINLITF